MATKEMSVAPAKVGFDKEFAFEAEDSLAAASNGEWILIPKGVRRITVTVVPGGGATAKIQTSTDSIEIIKSGTGITAVDWDAGAVSSTTQDVAYPVTAMRLVQIGAGFAKLSMRAQ